MNASCLPDPVGDQMTIEPRVDVPQVRVQGLGANREFIGDFPWNGSHA